MLIPGLFQTTPCGALARIVHLNNSRGIDQGSVLVGVWTIPRHLILLYVPTKSDPRSYGIRRHTRIEASQGPVSLPHRTRDQWAFIIKAHAQEPIILYNPIDNVCQVVYKNN